MSDSERSVAVLGASTDSDRPSNQAVRRYLDAGWTVWPVHPSGAAVHGQVCYRSLEELPGRPLIVSLYVNAHRARSMIEEIAACRPDWVWCNPGADEPRLVTVLEDHGLRPVVACNLVALSIGDPLLVAQRYLREEEE